MMVVERVYDTIAVLAGKKNPRDAWKALCEQYSEVVVKADNFQLNRQPLRVRQKLR
ncbi:MAG: hypothetical protein DSM106950_04955 [Stigonema ocellatum SAG 48.90 = DSM 106950]|nr:hypothetical protein [Stigonema ocellatum SAG 48.90 = DSM 106950]